MNTGGETTSSGSGMQELGSFGAFEAALSSFAIVTPDTGDERIDRAVHDVLRLVREHLNMDLAFVSCVQGGRRYFRNVEPSHGLQLLKEGASDPEEESFCRQVLDGRLPELVRDVSLLPGSVALPATPFRIGAHMSTPILLEDGTAYGTLCCFSFAANQDLADRDLKRLQMAAEMMARLIDQARRNGGDLSQVV